MCFGGDDAPKPPDPKEVAAAQAQANKETAQEQARLAMTGQTSDFGSLTYVSDPNSPSGYRAVQTLSPEDQALLAQQRDLRANLGDTTNSALNNVNRTITGTPFDLTAARGTEISDIQKTFLDPQWEQQRAALDNRLRNQGVRPGSEQYEIAMSQYSQQKDNSYNKMFLDAWSQANQAALTERNLPMQDYATLMGTMSPVTGNPAPISTPAPGVAPVDIGSYIYQSYNANAANAANQNSGLFGLAGTLGSAAIGLSDRRLKTDIVRVRDHPLGIGEYLFRYTGGDGTLYRGFMADEVRAVMPDAVVTIGGVDHVDYGKAAL